MRRVMRRLARRRATSRATSDATDGFQTAIGGAAKLCADLCGEKPLHLQLRARGARADFKVKKNDAIDGSSRRVFARDAVTALLHSRRAQRAQGTPRAQPMDAATDRAAAQLVSTAVAIARSPPCTHEPRAVASTAAACAMAATAIAVAAATTACACGLPTRAVGLPARPDVPAGVWRSVRLRGPLHVRRSIRLWLHAADAVRPVLLRSLWVAPRRGVRRGVSRRGVACEQRLSAVSRSYRTL